MTMTAMFHACILMTRSVIRNQDNYGVSALGVAFGRMLNVQDFQIEQTNVHMTSAVVAELRLFPYMSV
jgi:hypothetical protein